MSTISVPTMQDLLAAGVHFGHKVRRGNPKMKEFIFGAREGVHIIDLAKSEEYLKIATEAAYQLGKNNSSLLMVGTKKQAKDITEQLAKEAGAFYLNDKWVGGLLTNFDEVRRNIKKLIQLKTEQEKGELSRYTKKEQLLITRKLEKFERTFGGIITLERIPNALFVVDGVAEDTAVKEANKVGAILFGLCDSNVDPSLYDFPVPANDDGIKSIKIICETVIRAYGEGKKEAGKIEEKRVADAKKEEEAALQLSEEVSEQTAALEEVIEKEIVAASDRKVE